MIPLKDIPILLRKRLPGYLLIGNIVLILLFYGMFWVNAKLIEILSVG